MDPVRMIEEPLGSSPFVEVLVLPLTANSKVPANGFLASIGKQLKLGELRSKLSDRLELPPEGLSCFMSDGRDLSDELSMKENSIVLPGPSARREGKKVELYFDIVRDVLEAIEEAAQAEVRRLDKEEAARKQAELERERERLAREQEEQERKERMRKQMIDLDEVIQNKIGMPRALAESHKASDPEFRLPKHFLELVEPAQVSALQTLMQQTEVGGARVIAAFRNVNETIWHRYKTARQRLQTASGIKRRTTRTAELFSKNTEIARALGDFDASINEFPLWHGTGAPEKAGSICEVGFDPQYFGSHGSVYGAGFYFAERASVSHGYSQPWFGNSKHPRCQVMLLCRVLAGTMKESGGVPSGEERERLTAECLGPGGCFGANSSFHSVLGASWAYVAMHPHQTFPEYVIIYET